MFCTLSNSLTEVMSTLGQMTEWGFISMEPTKSFKTQGGGEFANAKRNCKRSLRRDVC